jgi:hypothetical protein
MLAVMAAEALTTVRRFAVTDEIYALAVEAATGKVTTVGSTAAYQITGTWTTTLKGRHLRD